MAAFVDLVNLYAERVMSDTARCVETRVRAGAPRASGELAQSIDASFPSRTAGGWEFELVQDASRAPHGNIIDKAKGGTIRPVSAQALRFDPGGGTIFRKSARQSTKHRGWWADLVTDSLYNDCLKASA